ncbi:hypothetical protein ACFOSV_16250 [Algoriphagus namhaensis]|uniref:Uncharacterized protein n=1 Tax=Algoriphagus namhaensis TaxID=915353 RepID=A0ABV8AUU1_9BACT
MKNVFYCLLVIFVSSCSSSQKMTIEIAAQDKVELSYPQYEMAMVDLKNKSGKPVGVTVLKQDDGGFVRGFGLGMMASESVMLEGENILILSNQADAPIKIKVDAAESNSRPVKIGENSEVRTFTLENTTGKSIPLLIPSVMNPNLSPFSKSGVDLKIGQEILFKAGGKKYVLLVVDETIKNGDVLNVAALLKERKSELNL